MTAKRRQESEAERARVRLQIRLPESLRDRVINAARDDRRSIDREAEVLFEMGLEARDRAAKEAR